MSPEPSPAVTVEVLLLSNHTGQLRFRQVGAALRRGAHPDDVARSLAGLTVCTPGGLLHSTSWRTGHGGVVLTYAALPDPRPWPDSRPVPVDAVAAAAGPLTPSPASIDVEAVAAHACRHLALLATTDDAVSAAAPAQRELWDLITKLTPAAAGALHPVPLVP